MPLASNSSIIGIFPPFRFEAEFSGLRIQIVESGSNADFRALDARAEGAQAAGRNMYKQWYLDIIGSEGDFEDIRSDFWGSYSVYSKLVFPAELLIAASPNYELRSGVTPVLSCFSLIKGSGVRNSKWRAMDPRFMCTTKCKEEDSS